MDDLDHVKKSQHYYMSFIQSGFSCSLYAILCLYWKSFGNTEDNKQRCDWDPFYSNDQLYFFLLYQYQRNLHDKLLLGEWIGKHFMELTENDLQANIR